MSTITGQYSQKNYRCKDCGFTRLEGTNHYGDIYSRCPECSWKVGQGLVSECVDPLPEGWGTPEPWKLVKLGDIAEIQGGVRI